jgi:hypothetical protein
MITDERLKELRDRVTAEHRVRWDTIADILEELDEGKPNEIIARIPAITEHATDIEVAIDPNALSVFIDITPQNWWTVDEVKTIHAALGRALRRAEQIETER